MKTLNRVQQSCKELSLLALALIILMPPPAKAQADSEQKKEYQIKAAFLHNFIKFVDWPEEKTGDSNEPIIIGIIGKDPFGKAFDPVKDKLVKGKKITIKQLGEFEELKKLAQKEKTKWNQKVNALRKCHVLFICTTEKKHVPEIINLVKNHNVMTVGDMKEFLESGGIINLVIEERKICFEVNVAVAKKEKLKIRSQLLRLAKRVIDKKVSGENQGKSQMQEAVHGFYAKNDN